MKTLLTLLATLLLAFAQETINIPDAATADAKRDALVASVWGPAGFPSGKPVTFVQQNIPVASCSWVSFLADCESLARVDFFYYSQSVTPPNTGVIWTYSFRLTPLHPNGDLFIYHAGHSSGAIGETLWARDSLHLKPVIFELLDAGYTVLTFNMPLYDGNSLPAMTTPAGAWSWSPTDWHGDLAKLDPLPLRFFFEKIPAVLDWAGAANYHHIFMMGLSGGGWTTTVYAAMDHRIAASFPVAGSVPVALRVGFEGMGDWEQTDAPSVANYRELYVLATWKNRLHFQFLNQFDTCCFWGTRHTAWVADVGWAAQQLSEGRYRFQLDTDFVGHWVSPKTMTSILEAAKEFSQHH